MSKQFAERRAAVRAKYTHPVDERWYRCCGYSALISSCYRLRPALFLGGRLSLVGDLVKPITSRSHDNVLPTYHLWTGTRYVDVLADDLLSEALKYSSVPVELL